MSRAKPRFIAGAVCPSCRTMDRIVVEKVGGDPDKERRRCVECGYSDEQNSGASREPHTRVTSPNIENAHHENADNEKTPIRILDPGKIVNSD
ncbi:MAG: YheV family putative metal-binding protein [Gammaproteobacteria bacterium]|nr:YheV family putative metal-binding protein [Gammaproteobacteria bacterium]